MEEQVETHVAHFSVDGGFVTDRARDLLLSEMPGKAWRLIALGLNGPEADVAARGILDATHRLEGVNELDLVEEDRGDLEVQRYLQDVAYIYAGRIRINGAWYRPSARAVPNWDAAMYATDGGTDNNLTLRRWMLRVGQWFLREGEIARINGTPGKNRCVTIWEPCGEQPFWWPDHATEEDAIADFEAKRRSLETRGRNSEDLEAVSRTLRARSEKMEDDADDARRIAQKAHEEEKAARFEARCAEIAEKVREQAGDDTFKLVVPATDGRWDDPTPERVLTIPRAPFWCWALERTSLKHLAPEWKTVSHSGMKLPLDNPYHTDWMLGAGLDLGEDYGALSPVTMAATEEMHRIQEEVGNFKAAVLVDYGMTRGVVGKQVLVIPNLSPDYAAQAMEPGVLALITEVGGELAHLAVVGREMGWTIMRVRDATRRFLEGMTVTLDPERGDIYTEKER